MVQSIFDALFVAALIAQPFGVAVGVLLLFVPRRKLPAARTETHTAAA
jgi:hypothetical protein